MINVATPLTQSLLHRLRSWHCCLVLYALIALPGCNTHPLFSWPEPSPLGGDLPSFTPLPKPEAGSDSGAPLTFSAPTTLTLRDAMAAALLHNPELASFAWEIRAAEARALQASLLPNPEAGVEVENFGGSGGLSGIDGAGTTFSISQLFLLGGKLSTRTRLASLDRNLSAFDYETTRVEVLTTVARRFVHLLGAQQRVDIADKAHDLASQVFEVVKKRVDAGDLSPVEQTRSRVTVSTTRLALKQTRRRLVAARLCLAALWSSTTPTFQTAEGPLSQVPVELPTVATLASLISQNPDIARWAVEMSKHETALALARTDAVPDITVEGGLRHFNDVDDTAFVVGLTLPLPLFDRNQGGRLEATYNINKAREQRRAAETRVRTALASGYEALSSSHTAVMTLRDDILPNARLAFDATKTAFQEGKLGYLDILDAQRTLIQLEAEYLDALTTFHTAASEVERLIAQPLEDVALSESQGALP